MKINMIYGVCHNGKHKRIINLLVKRNSDRLIVKYHLLEGLTMMTHLVVVVDDDDDDSDDDDDGLSMSYNECLVCSSVTDTRCYVNTLGLTTAVALTRKAARR